MACSNSPTCINLPPPDASPRELGKKPLHLAQPTRSPGFYKRWTLAPVQCSQAAPVTSFRCAKSS